MKDSNHFSGLTSAFRAAYESRANFGFRSAYEHKSIYISRPCARSRSRVWRVKELKKGEFFSLFDNVFKLGTIGDVFLKFVFIKESSDCGLLGDKCSIA